ncbi:MFS transporter [Herbiconiux sp. CPCC 205716]|uniref:MFS transporter n=1 Tax=Herbiconiux gentiana TaxID=2970912 RepID=A0ABT2GJU3_9MICO|nr:MFS transporter [Herbiconiux gentiana]MCS5715560.1 MFS transporter [Herbiconiux gentiana]
MTTAARLGRRGTFWAATTVLALCLWSSGAASVLYPSYAAEWSLPPVVTTSVFGAYPLALLIVLLLFGGISDAIGRRRAMLLGIALLAVAALVFAAAPNVGFLFAGRVLQGIGTGFALGAASAALVEHNPWPNPRRASSMTTVATSTGLTLALVVSGLLAQYAPLPLVLGFVVLFALALLAFLAVLLTPDDRPASAPGQDARSALRPQALRLPRGIALAFAAATLSVATAYSVGAIFLSLGAQMARELTGTTDLLVVGALLGISSATIGVTALLLGRVPALTSIVLGGVVSLAGLGLMAAAASSGSLPLFFAWCVVGGIGYSFAFTGGLGLANRAAPAGHRGAVLSLLYLFSYLLQALTAVGAGAAATALGLATAVDLAAPALAVLALATIVLVVVERMRGRSVSPADPAALSASVGGS